MFGSVTSLNIAPICHSFTDLPGSCFSYKLSSSSPLQYPLRLILFGSVPSPNFAPTCHSFTDPTGSCFSYNLSSSSPLQYPLRLILFGLVTSPNFAPTCHSFTDPPGSCFSYKLSSTSPPLGSFCSVQSPSPALRLLATLLLIRPFHALATSFPALLYPQGHFVRFSHLPQLCAYLPLFY